MSGRDCARAVLLFALATAYALTLARTARPPDAEGRADLLSPQGRAIERALAEGRHVEALALTQELKRLFPRDPFMAFLLATVYHALDQPVDEAAAWEEYVRTSDAPAEACPAIGLVYERVGTRDRALEHFRRCVALEPAAPDRIADLADAYARAGLGESAREAYQRAAMLDPRNPHVRVKAEGSRSPGDGQ